MAKQHMSIIGSCGKAMAGSSTMGVNLPSTGLGIRNRHFSKIKLKSWPDHSSYSRTKRREALRMGVDGMQAVGEMLAARARLNEGNQPRAGSMNADQKKTEATQNDESIDPVQVSSGLGCKPHFSKFRDYQMVGECWSPDVCWYLDRMKWLCCPDLFTAHKSINKFLLEQDLITSR